MTTATPLPTWRPAALRGLDHVDDHEEALVALGGEQYLRIPLPGGCEAAFRAQLGRRVWVDLEGWAVRLERPGAQHA